MKNIDKIIKKVLRETKDEMDVNDIPQFSVEPNVRKTPREKEIESLFGKYDAQIPPDVLRYMRKNPQLILDRMARIYGEKFIEYVDKAYVKSLNLKK